MRCSVPAETTPEVSPRDKPARIFCGLVACLTLAPQRTASEVFAGHYGDNNPYNASSYAPNNTGIGRFACTALASMVAQQGLDARPVMREADASSCERLVAALVPMPGKLKFDQDWLEWFFLMHDEAAVNDDVYVYLTARTVEHIRNSKSLDDGPKDEKAIEDRLADI
jgi:hypothetical protein